MIRAAFLAAPLLLAACGSSDAPTESTDSASSGQAQTEAVALTGEQIFKRCVACHKVEKGAASGLGPNLHGVAGRAIASTDGFNFSPALKAKGGVWDDANLDGYIENPRTFVPGNKMSFAGIKDAGERKLLIEYLKEQK